MGASAHPQTLGLLHKGSFNPKFCSYVAKVLNKMKIIGLYPPDIGPEALHDVTLRKLLCSFLGAIINLSQARMQEAPEIQVLAYDNYYYVFNDRLGIRAYYCIETTLSRC